MTSEFEILKPGKRWKEEYLSFANRDIFYNPEYYQINAEYANWQAELFLFRNKAYKIIYPYVKKPIGKLEFINGSTELANLFDISTLEYGGPIIEGHADESSIKEFHNSFTNYCKENKIVSEFIRLHPFQANHRHYPEPKSVKNVFYMDLTKPHREILLDFKKSNKNAITKARRVNVNVHQTKKADEIAEFYKIYFNLMKTKNAEQFYFYSLDFVKNLIKRLGEKAKLYVAEHNNKIIAGSFFLYDNHAVHYYLAANAKEFSQHCPGNLILYAAIIDSKNEGYKTFNLGGGYQQNDGLERFKATFTKTKKIFYRHTKIHNTQAYEMLSNMKAEFCAKKQKAYNLNYFPAYRG